MNEIQKAVSAFCDRLPRATETQAREEADRLFDEFSQQFEFFTAWKKRRDFDSEVRQAEWKAFTDRIDPENG